MPGMTPLVLTAMCRWPRPKRLPSLSAAQAASTASALRSGSPMPMKTMLVSRRPSASELSSPVAGLVDDLRGQQVAPQPQLTGGAEGAADGAPGLAGDAQRGALAPRAAGGVAHEHRLHDAAVIEAVERLVREPAVRLTAVGPDQRVEAVVGRQGLAQAAGQGVDVVEGAGTSGPDVVRQLARPEGWLAAVGEPREQLLWRGPGDAGPRVARRAGGQVQQRQGSAGDRRRDRVEGQGRVGHGHRRGMVAPSPRSGPRRGLQGHAPMVGPQGHAPVAVGPRDSPFTRPPSRPAAASAVLGAAHAAFPCRLHLVETQQPLVRPQGQRVSERHEGAHPASGRIGYLRSRRASRRARRAR